MLFAQCSKSRPGCSFLYLSGKPLPPPFLSCPAPHPVIGPSPSFFLSPAPTPGVTAPRASPRPRPRPRPRLRPRPRRRPGFEGASGGCFPVVATECPVGGSGVETTHGSAGVLRGR